MKIATWNVNSMKVRLAHVLEWLASQQPDVLVLQEIKQVSEDLQRRRDREPHGCARPDYCDSRL